MAMQAVRCRRLFAAGLLVIAACAAPRTRSSGVLASWNDTASKKDILEFVEKTTREGAPTYVPPTERITTFDNDGRLWAEQPMYFQGLFALDRIRAMAPEHPEWKTTEPFESAVAGDLKGLMAQGKEGVEKVLGAAHAGMTAEAFADSVREWLATASRRSASSTRRWTRPRSAVGSSWA
jgi:hypothetical protein